MVIQVCSRCATRWNVRDSQRVWCPRCHSALLPPSAPIGPPAAGRLPGTAVIRDRPRQQRDAAALPAGFRWIAVRPGPPPPPRADRRPLGPTPSYRSIPRWGLTDRPVADAGGDTTPRKNASAAAVRVTLVAAAAVFALAALAHVARYLLLLVNRTTLLPPLVAGGILLMGVLVSLAAMVSVIVTTAVLTSWLIGRRAAVFGFLGHDDPRSEWELWAGCLTPVVNLVWAPVFLFELARAEQSQARLRGPIVMWWIAWTFSTAISAWAIWTSAATDPQGIADNTVTVIIAYLAGLAVLILLWRLFDGFDHRPVERPMHRWVMVPADLDSTDRAGGPVSDPDGGPVSVPDGGPVSPDPPDDSPMDVEPESVLQAEQREPVA